MEKQRARAAKRGIVTDICFLISHQKRKQLFFLHIEKILRQVTLNSKYCNYTVRGSIQDDYIQKDSG